MGIEEKLIFLGLNPTFDQFTFWEAILALPPSFI